MFSFAFDQSVYMVPGVKQFSSKQMKRTNARYLFLPPTKLSRELRGV